MNISSTTTWPRELKSFNASFLSFDDPRFSWLEDQFSKHFEDWLTTIEKHGYIITNK